MSEILISILSISLIFCIFLQVLLRYVFNAPLIWTEPLARISFVWLCLIATSMVVRKFEDITIDIFFKKFPNKLKFFCEILTWSITGIFGIFVIIYGIKYSVMTKSMIIFGVGISAAIAHSSIPVGFFLVLLYIIEIIFNRINDYKNYQGL
jgi:TRAP-type C4-dicarboxylate transport system permease small subunit